MNKTIFIATMLAVATVLAAGITVLPGSVQEAQANPCSNNVDVSSNAEGAGGGEDTTSGSSGDTTSGAASGSISTNGDQNCDFTGPTEFDED